MDIKGKIAVRKVVNLRTNEEKTYIGVTPSEAVITAHAQSLGDFCTWYYTQDKYPVEFGEHSCICNDWCCLY